MCTKQLVRYGCLAVGMRVEYHRTEQEFTGELEHVRSDCTITGIWKQSVGVMVTLKGPASTIVQAFNSEGHALHCTGRLIALPD